MKLGQAFLVREHLEEVLGALGSRITQEKALALPTDQTFSEYVSALEQLKDVEFAITYTENVSYVGGVPLSFFISRRDAQQRMLDLLKRVDIITYKDKIIDLLNAIKADDEVLHVSSWSLDLQMPKLEASET